MTGCATQPLDSSERPKRTSGKTVLMSVNPSEENWQRPWWKEIIHRVLHPDHTHLLDTKSISVEVVEKRGYVVAGKIAKGGPSVDDDRYQRDKVMGRGRKIWGIAWLWKFNL